MYYGMKAAISRAKGRSLAILVRTYYQITLPDVFSGVEVPVDFKDPDFFSAILQ